MAACLGSSLLDMEQNKEYGPYLDQMKKNSNIQVKMMLFASYNAGATGGISRFKSANDEKVGGTYNWSDAKSKFSTETQNYVPGVTARLPISELKGLKDIDFSNAFKTTVTKDKKAVDINIMEMPTGYGVLTELENMDLSGNHFSTLPSDLKNLINMQTLNLSSNELSGFDIVSFIKNMTFLTNLNLANNGYSDDQVADIIAKLKISHPRLTLTFK
jgi:Leucine-rich repeat (LRR) protein